MAPAGREIDIAGYEIPVPKTIVGTPGCEGVAFFTLFQCPLPRFNLGEHLIERLDEKTGFAAAMDCGADGIVPVRRDPASDIGQLHQWVPNRGCKTPGDHQCGNNREYENEKSD